MDQQLPPFTSISMDDSPTIALPFEYNKEGVEPTETLAEAYVKISLIPLKYPRWIEFIPELPFKLRELAQQRAIE